MTQAHKPILPFARLLALAAVVLLASCGRTVEMTNVAITPEPVYMNKKTGSFTLGSTPDIYLSGLGQNSQTAKYIAKSMRHAHIRPSFVGQPTSGCITIGLNETINPEIGDEGYLLEVHPDGVSITANTEEGLFYGYQSFLQLLPADIHTTAYRRIVLPECTVLDYPRFAWRGAHLDVATHFFSVKFVKKYIDLMATLKLNKLQLTLANDYGYRLESKLLPQLNTVGSWRPSRDGDWADAEPPTSGEKCDYGGYYTAADIEALVAYAAERHVDIVPELLMPGGVSAIVAACPELSCLPDEEHLVQTGPYWPMLETLCLGSDSLMARLGTIVSEVAAMFPSRYINLGLDAAVTDHWESCPRCHQAMRRLNLKNEQQLAAKFVVDMEQLLSEYGKTLMARGLDPATIPADVLLQCSSNIKECSQYTYHGNFVVLSPDDYSLDAAQADPRYQKAAAPRQLTLRSVYAYEPLPQGTNSHVVSHVLGVQSSLPTEYASTQRRAELALLPRLCAVAEAAWSLPQNRNWPRFRRNIVQCRQRLAAQGYAVSPGSFKPLFHTREAGEGYYDVTLETEVPNTYIFYTTDGTIPTEQSPIYMGPIRLASGTHIKVLAYWDGHQREGVYEFVIGK
ncbi:MAG: family 20 glycosylhydrolase [Bacteroidales bacterium]|nr:family 20 glycosylhydrolase [Bacteroidales bacterium]